MLTAHTHAHSYMQIHGNSLVMGVLNCCNIPKAYRALSRRELEMFNLHCSCWVATAYSCIIMPAPIWWEFNSPPLLIQEVGLSQRLLRLEGLGRALVRVPKVSALPKRCICLAPLLCSCPTEDKIRRNNQGKMPVGLQLALHFHLV